MEPSMKDISKHRKMDRSYCERLHMTSDILVKSFLICKGYVRHLNKLWKGRTPCLGLAWKQKLKGIGLFHLNLSQSLPFPTSPSPVSTFFFLSHSTSPGFTPLGMVFSFSSSADGLLFLVGKRHSANLHITIVTG